MERPLSLYEQSYSCKRDIRYPEYTKLFVGPSEVLYPGEELIVTPFALYEIDMFDPGSARKLRTPSVYLRCVEGEDKATSGEEIKARLKSRAGEDARKRYKPVEEIT